MSENFSLGGLRKKVDLTKLKGGLKIEQFNLEKNKELKSIWKSIDADGNGTITADEMEAYILRLKDAAGSDNKLSRKEAKNADLGGKRGAINKFINQAIELSQNIKAPQVTPDELPAATVADTPNAEVTPTVIHDENVEIADDDEGVEPEELTPQDVLKNLFGDKKKASVKIDGSATGLGKAYQGEIRLANNETLEDGKFPTTLRMSLPAAYGPNASMKLTLIDEENGIYETSAHDRNFQIVADENGNITMKSVNTDELSGKLNANLAEYERLAAEKSAVETARTDDSPEVEQLSPEQIAAKKEDQRKAGIIATNLHNAAKGAKFNAVSGKEFQTALKQVNSQNASAVLSQYNTDHPDESLVRFICNEKTSNDSTRKAALNHIMTQLAAEAKAKGVPATEVDILVKEFQNSANKEFDSWLHVIDSTVMDNTMKRLLGLTQGVELNAGEVSAAEAKETVTGAAEGEYKTAKESFDSAREEEGWFAKRGDEICGLFGCTTKADMEAKLGKYKGDIEKLQNCKTEEEFTTAYKEVFGIKYDGKKVAAYQAAVSDYTVAYGAKENVDKMNTLFNDAHGLDYDAYKSKVMSAMNMSADEVDALVDDMSADYMAKYPHTDKKDVLRHWVDTQKQQSMQQFDQIAKGRTLEQISQDVDSVRQAAFGTNDIVNDVMKYNANQQITGMAAEAAAEIAVTVALSAVPGGQVFAAARLAANAAKWGARGVKLARYMPKAVNLATKAAGAVKSTKVAQTTAQAAVRTANAVKDSKLVRTATSAAQKVKNATPAGVRQSAVKIARGSDAAFEGTFAVNIADGKSVEDSVKKALQNAAFAGAGATSAELAPFLAKSLGCSSKIAEEMCEHALDVASSAGISYGVTGGYTSDDALQDLLTGVIMNRIGKGFKGDKQANAPAPAPQPKVLDRATSNNSATPGGQLSQTNFEQAKREVKEELAAGATPTRAAEIHNEADKLQIQNRTQGHEIKHIVEDAVGVYDSPTLGKIDLAAETDLSKLQQAKKEISQWFDGKKDVRGDAARDRQALLEKIDNRMSELNAKPELQGKEVKSDVVDAMNENTAKDAAAVLANEGKPLSPHGAAILDDKIKIMNSVEELEAMKKQLETRVGYQVQGVDHAAATIKKLDAKINNAKAHQADFAATTAKLEDAIASGKGLNADDLNMIRTFAQKCNSADELKQIVDKMNSSKAIKSFGGSKKLIGEINAKIETLNVKAQAQSLEVKPEPIQPTKSETPVVENKSAVEPEAKPVAEPVKPETPADPHHIELSESLRSVLDNQAAGADFVAAQRTMKPNVDAKHALEPKTDIEPTRNDVVINDEPKIDVPKKISIETAIDNLDKQLMHNKNIYDLLSEFKDIKNTTQDFERLFGVIRYSDQNKSYTITYDLDGNITGYAKKEPWPSHDGEFYQFNKEGKQVAVKKEEFNKIIQETDNLHYKNRDSINAQINELIFEKNFSRDVGTLIINNNGRKEYPRFNDVTLSVIADSITNEKDIDVLKALVGKKNIAGKLSGAKSKNLYVYSQDDIVRIMQSPEAKAFIADKIANNKNFTRADLKALDENLLPEVSSYKLSKTQNVESEIPEIKISEDHETFIDLFKKFKDVREALTAQMPVGEVASLNGKLFCNTGDDLVPINMLKEKFTELFPPNKRHNISQGGLGDCWLVTSMGALMDSPKGRAAIYKMFNQVGDDIYVQFPDANVPIRFKKGKLNKLSPISVYMDGNNLRIGNGGSVSASKGIRMLEEAYAIHRNDGYTKNITVEDVNDIFFMDKKMKRLEGGWQSEALSDIVGENNVKISSGYEPSDYLRMMKDNISDQNKIVTFATKDNGGTARKYDLQGGHAYRVVGFDEEKGLISISNPWHNNTVKQIPVYDWLNYIDDVTVTEFV